MRLDLSRREIIGAVAGAAAAAPGSQAAAASGQVASAPTAGPAYRTPRDMLASITDGVFLNQNECAHGPCPEARALLTETAALDGRYGMSFVRDMAALFAEQNGLKPENVVVHPGSFLPLRNAALAFATKERPLVYASPTFDPAFFDGAGAPAMPSVVVPLVDHRVDVRALVKAAPNAGVIHVCNPNNPTGLVVSEADMDWLMANKPKGAIVLVDEAYIHFSGARSALPRVAAGDDVLVLRTFSKIYGLAGLRCGLVMGRPDLLERMSYLGVDVVAMPAVLAAQASLLSPNLVAERKAYNARVREDLFAFLRRSGRPYLPSDACFAMIDVGRPGDEVIKALAERRVFVSGRYKSLPNWVRVSYGTTAQMDAFKSALAAILA